MIDANQLLEFFEAEYAQDVEADELKKNISEELKGYANNIGVSPKSLKTAFSLYKKFRSGKNSNEDCSAYALMSGIVEEYFTSGEGRDLE